MDFLFLDQELNESKLFRHSGQFSKMTGREVANLFYLYMLGLYILSQDKTKDFAEKEALKTIQYGSFTLFRTHATDLYMMMYQIKHPDNDHGNIKTPLESKRFLNSLNVNVQTLISFLRALSQDVVDEKRAGPFLFRLESQLKIQESRYKSWRRKATEWAGLNQKQKQEILTPLVLEIKRIGGGSARSTIILNQLELLSPKRIGKNTYNGTREKNENQ